MKRVTFGQQMAREEGREERNKEIALQMLEKGEGIAKICEYTGLSEKQVKELMPQKAA